MTLRAWQLTTAQPFMLTLKADPRLPASATFTNDWSLTLGAGDQPVVRAETRYPVGGVSLAPQWILGTRAYHRASDYHTAPFVRHIAPGYIAFEAALTATLRCAYEYWMHSSDTIAMRVSIKNEGESPVDLRFDLIVSVTVREREGKTAPAALDDGTLVLTLGTIGDLQPVVALDHPTPFTPTHKRYIGAQITLAADADESLRFACASLPTLQASGDAAVIAAGIDWIALRTQIERATARIPVIETGDVDSDAALAFSYQAAMQTPDPALKPENAPDWYLLTTALAYADPQRAIQLIRTALSAQANPKPDALWMPILARAAWIVYEATNDQAFLRESYPALIAFFERWRSSECDPNGSGIPKWQMEGQNGFLYAPTFALSDPKAQHAAIHTAEAPDMAAYMLSEALHLGKIAAALDETTWDAHAAAAHFTERLQTLWRAESARYTYRDRDTHESSSGVTVLQDARADEEQFIALDLQPPARLIVHLSGGASRKPAFSVVIDGTSVDGAPQLDRIDGAAFDWRYGRGVATSERVFATLNRVKTEGLSGLYRISARTPDWTRLDYSALMPLIAASDAADPIAARILPVLHDEARFWRPAGVPMVAADDPDYRPAENAAIRPFWIGLLCEALLDIGQTEIARTLLRRLLDAQIAVLKRERAFAASYHPETGDALGLRGGIAGIMPLSAWLRAFPETWKKPEPPIVTSSAVDTAPNAPPSDVPIDTPISTQPVSDTALDTAKPPRESV
jgi:hypothetical protein